MGPSTTLRMTIALMIMIRNYCVQNACGVIVRQKGVEVGVTADDFVGGKLDDYKELTIPRSTVATMKSDNLAVFTPFDQLELSIQADIRNMFGINELYQV